MITLIVPTKDEAENLHAILTKAKSHVDEIVVVDGHSQDGTREIAASAGVRVVLDHGRGKGDAVRLGIQEARGDILVFMDADGSHDPADIPELVRPILENCADHVSGSRMRGGSDELHSSLYQFMRLVGSQIITLGINYVLNVRLTDCQNGFRAIKKEVATALNLKEDITTIEQEMIIKTIKRCYRIVEVPTHEYARKAGQSKVQLRRVWVRYIYSWLKYLFFSAS